MVDLVGRLPSTDASSTIPTHNFVPYIDGDAAPEYSVAANHDLDPSNLLPRRIVAPDIPSAPDLAVVRSGRRYAFFLCEVNRLAQRESGSLGARV
jgi:hypothetical protein